MFANQNHHAHVLIKKTVRWYTCFGEITVAETVLREGGQSIRPFLVSTNVRPKSCSFLLQRRIVDFSRVCQAFCVNSSFLSYSGQLHDRHKPTVSNPEFLSSSTLYSTSSIHPEQPERAALQATHL